MWVCVLGLIYNFLGYPFIRWINAIFEWTNTPPELDGSTLAWLVAGLFGLTAARTYGKHKRVAHLILGVIQTSRMPLVHCPQNS